MSTSSSTARPKAPLRWRLRRKVAFLELVTLKGRHAQLVLLSHDHHHALCEAVRDGELWKLCYTTPSPEGMKVEIGRRLGLREKGSMLPFTVLNADKVEVGMTTYMNVDAATGGWKSARPGIANLSSAPG